MADLAVWQRTIVDEEGNVIPGAEVEVRREEDGSLATLYADRAGETPLANPLAADMSGFVQFFVQGGAYTITAVGAGSTRTWRFDPTGRLQEFDRVSEALAIADGADTLETRRQLGEFATVADVQNSHIPPVIDSIRTNGYYTPGDGGGALYKRMASEPSHNSKIQSADGAWWEPAVPFGYTFDSVSDMKASRLVVPGARARTLGYYEPGDGGGNDYEIVAAGTGADDGGSFIDLAGSGLQAKGLFGGYATAAQFGAVPSPQDSSERLNKFHDFLRASKLKGFYAAGAYTLLSSVDVSGVDIEGVLSGYLNEEGTRLECSGNDAFVQESTSAENITYSIKKFRVSGANVALNMKYAVYANVEDFYVRDSAFGIICGGTGGAAGPLWCTFKRGDIRVSDTALIVQGGSWANANLFEAMYFAGDVRAAYMNAGGLGAISNQFIDVEFAGPAFGFELGRNKSTSFNNCFFESKGPSIYVTGSTSGLSVTECSFAGIREDNPTGILSHFYHESSLCRVLIQGGYVYYKPEATYASFIRSANPDQFVLKMTDFPAREGPGDWFYDTASVTRRSKLRWQGTYDIDWRGSSANPSIGNGTIKASYFLEGNLCTVNVEIEAGSTTDFGAGQWTMRVPFPSSSLSVRNQGTLYIRRSNGENYIGTYRVGAGITNGVLYVHGTSLPVSSNIPYPFGEGDRISFSITYPIAERG